ncbi:MAG: riboflavin biosynthesis protein RibF [Coriobacteriia bacterium]
MSARLLTWSPASASLGPAVVALGVFDGVHVGHAALVRDAVAIADVQGVASIVVTFDRDPDRVVDPDRAAPQLLELDDKLDELAALSPGTVLVIPFDTGIASMAPDAFLADVLSNALDPVSVVVGHDFRFGRGASGDVAALERFGARAGFTVIAHRLVEDGGLPVSSTRIRGLVAAGDVVGAARLLARPHRVRGTVVHGRAAGKALGVPTANISVPAHAALPGAGVFAGRVHLAGGVYPSAISVGVPPTFPQAHDLLEAHIIDFVGDIYGAEVTVEFLERLRDQRRFEHTADLTGAILDDIRAVRQRVV